jgi:hypothetical protein
MATRERRDEEFYESMPATMGKTGVQRQAETRREDDAPDRSLLPWLLIPAALLLGWLLLSALNNNKSNNGSNTGTSGQTQTQQNGTTGGTGSTGTTQ